MRAPDAISKFQKAVFPMTLPNERAKYSAIVDRPKLQLPNGERVVIWTVVNVEVWDIARPMPRQVLVPPTGVTRCPTCRTGAGTNTACASASGASMRSTNA